MKTLLIAYLKLGIIFGPLGFLYGLWDARYHPTPMTLSANELLPPIRWRGYALMFVLCFLFWPIHLVAIVYGYTCSVIFYCMHGTWPP